MLLCLLFAFGPQRGPESTTKFKQNSSKCQAKFMQIPKTRAKKSEKYIKMTTNHASKSSKINYAKKVICFIFIRGEYGIVVIH